MRLRLPLIVVGLVAVNLYVFVFRGDTSLRALLKSQATQKPSSTATKPGAKRSKLAPPVIPALIKRGDLRGTNGLSAALARAGLSPAQCGRLIAALRPALDLRALRPHHSFVAEIDPKTHRLRRFVFRLSAANSIALEAQLDGSLRLRQIRPELETKTELIAGRVQSSLAQAIADTGEHPSLVPMFTDLFSWDINWYVDPRRGDRFRVRVEKRFLKGKFYRYGKIIAAEYDGARGKSRVFYFRPSSHSKGQYVTQRGHSVRRPFLRTPLRFARVSSTFNRHRFHPVLKREKSHNGTDFAAPTGTAVWAAANGTVISAGWAGALEKWL